MNANASPIDEVVAEAIRAPIEALLELDGGAWTLVMRREFPQSPARLWAMLTEPELLGRWSPVIPDRPLTSVGPASCVEHPGEAPRDAEVLAVDPPRTLVHRWGSDVLSWTVSERSGGSLLELRQSVAERAAASMYAAGWRVCLGRLGVEDEQGSPRERVVGMRAMDYGWAALRDAYEVELGGSGSGEAEPIDRARSARQASSE